jgi:hypothetical protein
MTDIVVQQAIYLRAPGESPRLQARSAGFLDGWLPEVETLVLGFGERPAGVACPAAIFARPLSRDQVAVVHVADQPADAALRFHVLVLARSAYRGFLGDPFALAERLPPPWHHGGADLPAVMLPAQPPPRRTVAEVQQVLKRVKAGALREDEDPETVERTPENSESPALLGGVQVLVDGGRVVFVRSAPDPSLIRGLWTLLPDANRCELWPATFAFSNALGFDALVVPGQRDDDYTGYTTEELAGDYPAGRYELSLQTAAEAGDQATLDSLFTRRSSRETLRLGIVMVVVLSIAVFLLRWFGPATPPAPWTPERRERAAAAAAMVGNADPWTTVALHELEAADYPRKERAASAAGIVASGDPFTAAVQARSAYARYVEIWKPAK